MTFVTRQHRGFRLGTDISSATSLDEALTMADLNFGVKVVGSTDGDLAVREDLGDGRKSGWVQTRIPGRRILMRDDNWDILGVVGSDYQGVSNPSAFGVADLVRTNIPGARFDRAFGRDYGREANLSLAMPDFDLDIGHNEVFKLGMHFSTSHDGGSSILGRVVLERQICTNGMTVEIKGVGSKYKIRHTLSAELRLARAHEIMADSTQYIERFVQNARFMINTPMSNAEYGSFIDDLFPQPTGREATPRKLNAWAQHREQLIQIFSRSMTTESGRGTRWAAFNSITEDADWGGTVQRGNASDVTEARALRQLDGTAQTVKDRAFFLLAA